MKAVTLMNHIRMGMALQIDIRGSSLVYLNELNKKMREGIGYLVDLVTLEKNLVTLEKNRGYPFRLSHKK